MSIRNQYLQANAIFGEAMRLIKSAERESAKGKIRFLDLSKSRFNDSYALRVEFLAFFGAEFSAHQIRDRTTVWDASFR